MNDVPNEAGISYRNFVDYDKLDPVKRLAMDMFASTLKHSERLRIRVMPTGESGVAFDFLDYDFMIGFNVEGLGTKNDIADKMYAELKEQNYPTPEVVYWFIGQDTAAMSAMDLASCGADPFGYGDFLTAGSADWFNDPKRNEALLSGYKTAADLGLFAIPCGETPALPDIVNPNTLVLEGASIGLIKPKERLSYGQKIKDGDLIFGLPSNGVAANGISLARKIATNLPKGYFTELPSGATLGKALLVPTPIYVRSVIQMFDEADLHYASPITGHAWEKVGRAKRDFTYVIENLPEPPEVFKFLIEEGSRHKFDVSDRENYYVWNMGTSIALIAPADSADRMRAIAEQHGTELQILGHVEEGERKVVLTQKNVKYTP
ncbi:MAG: AIR synthase-related protein [Candidatus Aenigmarchaeota archaeon]|nr:AIR synthase-related protein [Candidatus Aenigmarchaeota archaeon]